MAPVTVDSLDRVFDYHAPDAQDVQRHQKLRDGAKAFARIILENTPVCADQSSAIRDVRNALMTANAAVATDGAV